MNYLYDSCSEQKNYVLYDNQDLYNEYIIYRQQMLSHPKSKNISDNRYH